MSAFCASPPRAHARITRHRHTAARKSRQASSPVGHAARELALAKVHTRRGSAFLRISNGPLKSAPQNAIRPSDPRCWAGGSCLRPWFSRAARAERAADGVRKWSRSTTRNAGGYRSGKTAGSLADPGDPSSIGDNLCFDAPCIRAGRPRQGGFARERSRGRETHI